MNNSKGEFMSTTKEKEKIEQLKQDKADADLAAQSKLNPVTGKSFSDINEVTNLAREASNMDPSARRTAMMKSVGEVANTLMLLCLEQALQTTELPDYMSFANAFDDGYIASGNSKEYVFQRLTGIDSWDPDLFVPNKVTKTSVAAKVISIYNPDGTLSPQGHQFKKNITIQEAVWLPYFIAGKVAEFIAMYRNALQKVFRLYKYDLVMSMITGSTPAKVINGTADNMFDCFVKEIIPTIRDMTTMNNQYNYAQDDENIQYANPEDLFVIMNGKVITQLESGIKSQLFNSKLLNIHNVLDETRIINPGNKITVPHDSDQLISVGSTPTPYVDENTVWIVHKDALKFLMQIDRLESQNWTQNMTIQLVLHAWFCLDFLPWGMIVKYTNKNLMTMPN